MKKKLFVIFIALTFINCSNQKKIDGIYVDFKKIETVKKHLQQKDKNYFSAYGVLIKNADLALAEGPFSVMDKLRTPPSGDKHDYLSMGPYWWPDTTKADGLPYIRRDGEINPETRGENVDRPSAGKLFANVETLAGLSIFRMKRNMPKKRFNF